jgi:hypothetical protein
MVSKGPLKLGYRTYADNTLFVEDRCVRANMELRCYSDSICCKHGKGSYHVYLEDIIIAEGGVPAPRVENVALDGELLTLE